ncbi:MAG: glycosyltransferase family 39 protein [Deltaproteobacteria bacterium]|nr:glycosyltransferase family 39 protein [Deltaproteobacteria bacterium]
MNAGIQSRRAGLAVHGVGLIIAAGYVAVLLATAGDVGFSRDEGFYFTASEHYMRWFDLLGEDRQTAVTQQVVDRHWRMNSEHPPLMKVLFGLSWKLFAQKLDWMRESTAFRFPGMVMGGLLLYLVVVFGTRIADIRVGVFAALALALMPRFFYHAHLNCFDVPMATMWFAVMAAFHRSLTSWKWAIVTGVLWGLALATKLNAFFIPVVLIVYWLVRYFSEFRLRGGSRGGGRLALPGVPLALFAMLVIGPLVLYALWPWLWFDTLNRFGGYLGFHKHHPYYNIAYFGVTYFEPPFPISYPFVMTLVTAPFVTMVTAFVGMGERLVTSARRIFPALGPLPLETLERERARRGLNFFLALNMLVPILIIAWPSTPIFGGTKHWLPAWPFIALFAGFGFRAASDGIARLLEKAPGIMRSVKGGRHVAAAALGAVLLVPAAQQTEVSHPFGLSHYTMLVGETPGSADAGMCRQFWGFTTGSALDWLNENVKPRSRVFFHDTAWDSFRMFQRDGSLRGDIHWGGQVEGSDVAMVHWEHHMSGIEYSIWTAYDTVTPSRVVTHQGVPILIIYSSR